MGVVPLRVNAPLSFTESWVASQLIHLMSNDTSQRSTGRAATPSAHCWGKFISRSNRPAEALVAVPVACGKFVTAPEGRRYSVFWKYCCELYAKPTSTRSDTLYIAPSVVPRPNVPGERERFRLTTDGAPGSVMVRNASLISTDW